MTKTCVLPFNSSETVTNISSHILTQDERESLKFGLSHAIFPPIINKTDIYASFESIYQSMKSRIIDKSNDSKVKSDLYHITQLYVNSFKPSNKDIQNHKVLKNLHKNKDILILKQDKGNGMVILYKVDYIKGINEIVIDKNKFKELPNHPTINREDNLQRFSGILKPKVKLKRHTIQFIDKNKFKELPNHPTINREDNLQRFSGILKTKVKLKRHIQFNLLIRLPASAYL